MPTAKGHDASTILIIFNLYPDLPLKISKQLFPILFSPLLQDEAMKLSLFTEAVHIMRLNPNNLSIACSISVGSDNTARSIQCLNRDLTKLRRRRQGESQKTIGLMRKTTTLHVHHAFLHISLLSLHNNDVKSPHF